MEELKKRKTTRLMGTNYNRIGMVFLTICTKERRCILSRIVGNGVPDGPKIELTKYGLIAEKYINQLSNFYNDLSVESYVIMPNHIHIMLWVKGEENVQSKTPVTDGPTNTPTIDGPSNTPTTDGPSNTPVTDGPSRTPVPTRGKMASTTVQNSIPSRFVSTFKRFCNKEYGTNIWQYRSHDHIIRNRKDYEEHSKYIYENPVNWRNDELYTEE